MSTPVSEVKPASDSRPKTARTGPLLFFVALFFLVGGGLVIYYSWKTFQRDTPPIGSAVEGPVETLFPAGKGERWIKEFTLTERSGATFNSTDMRGKVWVTSFFFASCPSSCVKQNQLVKSLHDEFGPQGVTFVSITCDPVNDTPERLREYARKFQADDQQWQFLTGDMAYIRRVGGERFSLPVNQQTHADRFVVVDKWGENRASFNWHDEKQVLELKQLLPKLLEEQEPPQAAEPEPAKRVEPAEDDDADEDSADKDSADKNNADKDNADKDSADKDDAGEEVDEKAAADEDVSADSTD